LPSYPPILSPARTLSYPCGNSPSWSGTSPACPDRPIPRDIVALPRSMRILCKIRATSSSSPPPKTTRVMDLFSLFMVPYSHRSKCLDPCANIISAWGCGQARRRRRTMSCPSKSEQLLSSPRRRPKGREIRLIIIIYYHHVPHTRLPFATIIILSLARRQALLTRSPKQ
jgi:hypothetical protein